MSRQQELGDIPRGLKNLAKELRVCVVALAQMNREAGLSTSRPGRRREPAESQAKAAGLARRRRRARAALRGVRLDIDRDRVARARRSLTAISTASRRATQTIYRKLF
ncbi:DnaB-like helicase C-terminal domain-containing protein [Sorangium sp. So ce1128]